jgi:hypothetical protein
VKFKKGRTEESENLLPKEERKKKLPFAFCHFFAIALLDVLSNFLSIVGAERMGPKSGVLMNILSQVSHIVAIQFIFSLLKKKGNHLVDSDLFLYSTQKKILKI